MPNPNALGLGSQSPLHPSVSPPITGGPNTTLNLYTGRPQQETTNVSGGGNVPIFAYAPSDTQAFNALSNAYRASLGPAPVFNGGDINAYTQAMYDYYNRAAALQYNQQVQNLSNADRQAYDASAAFYGQSDPYGNKQAFAPIPYGPGQQQNTNLGGPGLIPGAGIPTGSPTASPITPLPTPVTPGTLGGGTTGVPGGSIGGTPTGGLGGGGTPVGNPIPAVGNIASTGSPLSTPNAQVQTPNLALGFGSAPVSPLKNAYGGYVDPNTLSSVGGR